MEQPHQAQLHRAPQSLRQSVPGSIGQVKHMAGRGDCPPVQATTQVNTPIYTYYQLSRQIDTGGAGDLQAGKLGGQLP